MAVSKRLRFEILRRDNNACRYCGATSPEVALTIDHVVPVALGGSDDPSNLVTACRDCNAGKSSVPADATIVANVASDALRWAAAMQEAQRAALVTRNELIEIEKAVWDALDGFHGYIPADWFGSIEQLSKAGLHRLEIIDAAHIAAGARGVRYSDVWRYFCGVCWRKLRNHQEAAQQIIQAAEPERPPLRDGQAEYAALLGAALAAVCDRSAA